MAAEVEEKTEPNPSTDVSRVDEKSLEPENFVAKRVSSLLVVLITVLPVACISFDNSINTVAIPKITDHFQKADDIGWYASVYLFTLCAFQLLFGKLYTIYSIKIVFLVSIIIFELGSLLSGVAPTSTAFIVARAITGLGCSGILLGSMVVVIHLVTKNRVPVFLGLIGATYGIVPIVAPVIGGAYSDRVTWRLCYYTNLPLGAIAIVVVIFLLKVPPRQPDQHVSALETLKRLDPLGTVIFIVSIICVLLAVQQGGVVYAWSSGRIVGLFVAFAVLLLAFVFVQMVLKDDATLPPHIATQRTVGFAGIFSFFLGASWYINSYYVVIWFQTIKGASAVQSGVHSLPIISSMAAGLVAAGALTTKFGHYAPFFVISTAIMSAGAGLVMLFDEHSSSAKWIIFQLIYGFGVGLGSQQSCVAAQAVLPLHEASIGTAMASFAQLLGGSIFVSVAQNLFINKLVTNIAALDIPNLNPAMIVNSGTTGYRELVDPEHLPQVISAYNGAFVETYQLALITACISIIGAVGVEWKRIKKEPSDESPIEGV